MNPADLRLLAVWHDTAALTQFEVAHCMGACPAAADFRAKGKRHAKWARELKIHAGILSGQLIEYDRNKLEVRVASLTSDVERLVSNGDTLCDALRALALRTGDFRVLPLVEKIRHSFNAFAPRKENP